MTDQEARTAAAAALANAARRADHRTTGELVQYPRLVGVEHIDTIGKVESIRCTNPDDPYDMRTLRFVIVGLDGKADTLNVHPSYDEIITLEAERDRVTETLRLVRLDIAAPDVKYHGQSE